MPRIFACFVALLAWSVLHPSVLQARIPLQPDMLLRFKADSILLVYVTEVHAAPNGAWTANGVVSGRLFGPYSQRKITFGYGTFPPRARRPSDDTTSGIIVPKYMGQPKVGRFQVVYLARTKQSQESFASFPYWFARASNDPRLIKMDKLLPLGGARRPSAQEMQLIDPADARLRYQIGTPNNNRFTRVYARASASTVSVLVFPSRVSQILIVDGHEEFSSIEKSCRCNPRELSIDLKDLWDAGKLPSFP